MLWLLLAACLVDADLYEERSAALADEDGDGVSVAEGDCDDTDAGIAPGQPEQCDGVDQDCDGDVDEDPVDPGSWYADADGDQVGAGEPVQACEAPEGWVAAAGDCDDGDDSIHPGADEVPYDGVDQDCDEADLTDIDGDGVDAVEAGGEDCDDDDPDTWPGAPDSWYDGVDSDCAGDDDYDADRDGSASNDHGGTDCDDGDPTVYPEAVETWANGATDNDCDGDYGAATLEYGATAWTGEAAGDNAGRRVAAIGDVTGDGLAEFAVGAPYQGSTYSYGGAVYVVGGGGEPGPLAEEGVLRAGGASWLLGSELSSGDVDGDGVADLLLSATGYDSGAGAAWLISGPDLPEPGTQVDVDAVASWQVTGDASETYAGGGLAIVGDLDGDGLNDVALGAPYADNEGYVHAGRVGVFLTRDGSPSLEDADLLADGDYEEAGLGGRIQPAGDQDDDGYDDFMVSYSGGRIAQILPGGTTLLDLDDPISEVVENGELDRVDPWMVGDVDGDGQRDLAVIIDSTDVRLFRLLSAVPVRTHDDQSYAVSFEGATTYNFQATGLPDLDGDGREELLVHPQYAGNIDQEASEIIWGADLETGVELPFGDSGLLAVPLRPGAAFGYRVALSPDIDGDANSELIIAGYADGEAGPDAGAVVTVPLPR